MSIDHDEIMRRVAAISPVLERNARACDAARQVMPESIAAMMEAGMFRISQPARNGGYELGPRTLADAVTALSQACPSSGWVLMVAGAHHWCMGSFPEAGQDEVFGDGRDVLIAGTLSWQGSAAAVTGGYRIDGRWQFGSGVDHSQWVMLGCADPQTHVPKVHVVARREEIEIDDTWHVMGLLGTGSKDVVARGVFVPEHRSIDTRTFFRAQSPHSANHPTNLYRLPAEAVLSLSVATALLGSARFALAQFIARTRERRVILTGARKAEHAPTQVRLAEAAAEIQSADLLIHDALGEFEHVMGGGESPDLELRTRVKWQAAYAAELCRRAVGRLYAGSGAHAVYESSSLQAAFRNINVGAQHASIDFDASAEQYARLRLGV
ncbi:MAG TPA: acyl-CoA dehydrogenase family protein [Candidatus Binataceae bacterium]|jgi:3-hydroxy-9,10-secoandrosta-1,3,5(10)-triene-9,17-dione monooxygenase|nr:acyl-CoA dehydrogenase family protein [Candidatus Binataceae bacterium]